MSLGLTGVDKTRADVASNSRKLGKMAGPGVLKNTVREREFQNETLKSGRSIKRNHVSAEREECVNLARRFNRCSCERLPPVPKRSDPAPLSYPPSQENYINYNSKHVADVANYHEPKLQVVDSKDGHTMDLEKSGLVPHFITKPTFGRVPSYLKNGQHTDTIKTSTSQPETARSQSIKDRPAAARSINKEVEMLQKRWIELENRLRLISFSRPDKRDAIEDELRSIEVSLRIAATS